MYEISMETIQLSPGTGVDQVCELIIELSADPRPLERLTIFPDRLEVRRYADPGEEMLRAVEAPPSTVESMLGSVKMFELSFDRDRHIDAFRLAFDMCRQLDRNQMRPSCWVVGDLDQLRVGLEEAVDDFGFSGLGEDTLYGLPVRVSAELGQDRLVLVGGVSRHHAPERATAAVSAFMPWAERS